MKNRIVAFLVWFLIVLFTLLFLGIAPVAGYYIGQDLDKVYNYPGMPGPGGFYEMKEDGSYRLVNSDFFGSSNKVTGWLFTGIIIIIELPIIFCAFIMLGIVLIAILKGKQYERI